MVVQTPWQFGEREAKNDVLPIIQHPMTKLGDPSQLHLRGTSRLTSRSVSQTNSSRLSVADHLELPLIPDGVEVKIAEDRSRPHIPIFGQSADISDRIESRLTQYSYASSGSRASGRYNLQNEPSVSELESRLRQKMRTGYYTLKNLFLSYDPDYATVDRTTLHRILSTFLVMKLSLSNFHRLMKRLGFSNAKKIKLDEFYGSLKKRKEQGAKENEYPDWFEQNELSERQATANQVHTYLKTLEEKNMLLSTLEVNESGRIYKPVLLDKLKLLGYNIKPLELEKLWSRYDPLNASSIEVKLLRDILNGKSKRPQYNEKNNARNLTDRDKSISIEKWLNNTFRKGAKDFLAAFREFDPENSGYINRDDFLDVLKSFDLYLKTEELDLFLSRCNMECETQDLISYKDFINVIQCRNEEGLSSKVLNDKNHRFHKMLDERTVKTSLSNIESRLVDLFQKDYFILLNKFQKIDKRREGLISDIEFRAVLESFFDQTFTDTQFHEFVKKFAKVHGKIDYMAFMSKFDVRPSKSLFDATSVGSEIDEEVQTFRTVSQSTGRSTCSDDRSVDEVWRLISVAVRQKGQQLDKIFRELDSKNTNRMSIETFRKLLRRIDVVLSSEETKNLWELLIVDQHGTLHFEQFVRHFGFSIKSAAFPNSKKFPPQRGDSDCRMLSKKFNSWLDLIKGYAKAALQKEYGKLCIAFERIDESKSGAIESKQFQSVLEDICHELSHTEIKMITEQLVVSGWIDWKKFLAHLKPKTLISKTGYDMSDILKHR